jgi:hypothetical protein
MCDLDQVNPVQSVACLLNMDRLSQCITGRFHDHFRQCGMRMYCF